MVVKGIFVEVETCGCTVLRDGLLTAKAEKRKSSLSSAVLGGTNDIEDQLLTVAETGVKLNSELRESADGHGAIEELP